MTILVASQPIPYDAIPNHINKPAIWITESGRRMDVIIRAPIRPEDKFAVEPQGDFYDHR